MSDILTTDHLIISLDLPSFNSSFNQSLSARGCNPNGDFAIIVHGWLESYNTEWVQDLISNLTVFRGGCIILYDYSNYSVNSNYFLLVPQFENISSMLLRFMQQLDGEGFDFGRGYMFGFSFGAHLAITTATNFGERRFKEIDGKCLLISVELIKNKIWFIIAVCDPGKMDYT